MRRRADCRPCFSAAAPDFGSNDDVKKPLSEYQSGGGKSGETIQFDYRSAERICQYMSVSKFTPAELEELRRADAEIDAEDAPLEYELDAKLDIASAAQARWKTEAQIAAEKAYSRSRYQETKEYHQEYNRKYYAEHKEQQRSNRHQYYLNHKADYRERSHKYTKAHPERARERRRKYAEKVKSDPEKLEARRQREREHYQKNKVEINKRRKNERQKSKEKEKTPSESA